MLYSFLDRLSGAAYRDLARHARNHNHDYDPERGVLLIDNIRISGRVTISQNGKSEIFANALSDEGRKHILDVIIGASSKIDNWYLAPASGNVSYQTSWTAANWAANATELTTQYTNSTRILYVDNAAQAVGGVMSNSDSPFTVTSAIDNVVLWGGGLMSVSTKAATTGTLLSLVKFSSARTLVTAGDSLQISWPVTLS
jgi:hypothetical protein